MLSSLVVPPLITSCKKNRSTEIRNQQKETQHTHSPQVKRGGENISSQLMSGHERVAAAADLISAFVMTVIDQVVEQLWSSRLSQYRHYRDYSMCSEMLAVNFPDLTRTQDSLP